MQLIANQISLTNYLAKNDALKTKKFALEVQNQNRTNQSVEHKHRI